MDRLKSELRLRGLELDNRTVDDIIDALDGHIALRQQIEASRNCTDGNIEVRILDLETEMEALKLRLSHFECMALNESEASSFLQRLRRWLESQ